MKMHGPKNKTKKTKTKNQKKRF